MSNKLTIPVAAVKGHDEFSFTASVGESYVVRKKKGDREPALKEINENGRGQLGYLQRELVPVLWPLTDKVKV